MWSFLFKTIDTCTRVVSVNLTSENWVCAAKILFISAQTRVFWMSTHQLLIKFMLP